MKRIHYTWTRGLALAVFAICILTACTKYYDPEQIFEDQPARPYSKERKVMLIVVDGASGPEVERIMPTNIAGLLEHSKYAWESFSDPRSHDGPSWINLLTGRSAASLAITDSTMQAVVDDENPNHGEIPRYSTFLQRLLEGGVESQSVAISPWGNLLQQGFSFANQGILAQDDVAVKDTALNKLASMPRLGTLLVNFNSVNLAGLASAFSADEARYREAVNTIDAYIGELMAALKNRANYDREDWLVIITSSHGGLGNSYGGLTREERTIFTLFYNENFLSTKFETPEFTNAVRMSSAVRGTIPADQASIYNIGTSGEYTIQLKIKCHNKGTLNPAIISKQNHTGNTVDGWSFIHNGGLGWRFKIRGTQFSSNTVLNLEEWATLTAKIYMDGGTRRLKMFTNGTLEHTNTIGTAQGSSDDPLNVGWSTSYQGGTVAQTVTDIRIYNAALPDEHIQQTYCQTNVPSDDPYVSNLIGYWRANEASGGTFPNYGTVPLAPPFLLTGSYAWAYYDNNFCHVPVDETQNTNERIVTNSDVVSQIFYWMQIETSSTWALEGNVWLDRYEVEFIK